jgi:hypothetical protein
MAVLSDCLDYSNLYVRENVVTGQQMNQLGWLTTAVTKSFMIKEFGKALFEDSLDIPSRELLNQALCFKYYGGEMKVSEGQDDLLMSAMLSVAVNIKPQLQKGLKDVYGFSRNWGKV